MDGAHENLYLDLGTEDEKGIYKLVMIREKVRDLDQISCVKDENKTVVINKVIRNRRGRYL